MRLEKKRLFLYSSILLLFIIGAYITSATEGFKSFYVTGNTTAVYSPGSITLNWQEVNVTNPLYNLSYVGNITYFIYGSQNEGAFVLLDTKTNASAIGTTLTTLTFTNATGISANYTFRINATLYNGTNFVPLSSNLSNNISIYRDAEDPSASLSDPTQTSLTLGESIKYTCTCSDTVSGLSSCITVVTKPGGEEISKSGSDTEHTFSGTDVNRAGRYGVVCTATDVAGRTKATDQKIFAVSFPSGGGGGTSTAGTSPTSPILIGVGVTRSIGILSSSETYTNIAQGGTASFTAAGATHTAKVLTVTSTSATVELRSNPKQITLNVGETKEVDLNDNEMSDLSITLSSISGNVANLVFKVIQEATTPSAPGQPTEQPSAPTQPSAPGQVTGEPVRRSLAWLWWVIAILAVVLIVLYLRKKKQQ